MKPDPIRVLRSVSNPVFVLSRETNGKTGFLYFVPLIHFPLRHGQIAQATTVHKCGFEGFDSMNFPNQTSESLEMFCPVCKRFVTI